MKNVEWLSNPPQSKDYYVKKLTELRARFKLHKTPSLIDIQVFKDNEKELSKLAE